MNHRQQGLILFYTLLMTSLLALLVLSESQLVLLQLKAANRLLARHQIFQKLEAQVKKILRAGPEKWPRECISTEHNPNVVIKRLQNKKGCSIADKGLEYHYLLEDLGLFPCLQVIHNRTAYSTRHWRFTILASGYESMTLQVRIARKSLIYRCENNPVRIINTGVISWRHLELQWA